jgi:hypothetical protein
VKWYDHDQHMRKLSKKYPDILFSLYSNGEDIDNIWITYYKNGLGQFRQAKIVFDDYNPEKMT